MATHQFYSLKSVSYHEERDNMFLRNAGTCQLHYKGGHPRRQKPSISFCFTYQVCTIFSVLQPDSSRGVLCHSDFLNILQTNWRTFRMEDQSIISLLVSEDNTEKRKQTLISWAKFEPTIQCSSSLRPPTAIEVDSKCIHALNLH